MFFLLCAQVLLIKIKKVSYYSQKKYVVSGDIYTVFKGEIESPFLFVYRNWEQYSSHLVYLDDNNLSELPTDLLPWDKVEVLGMTGNSWLCNCDLANIITQQGAGSKFKPGQIPYCAAPMRLSGAHITNITVSFCPAFDTTFTTKKSFSFSDLKPKHVLWSILGVAAVVGVGMLCGLLVNIMKAFYKNIRAQPIRYININDDTNFA